MERWSNPTHTFLVLFREMTIMPLDFMALIGLVWWGSVPLDDRPAYNLTLIPQLLRCSPFIKDKKLRSGNLKTYLQPLYETVVAPYTNEKVDKCTRDFLILLFRATFFIDAESTIHLFLLYRPWPPRWYEGRSKHMNTIVEDRCSSRR
ncbi:conserved hypothetical protein [Ricinus communis]|uniref:Uncharacterized protein n=1 Tax=Ricinus communis TaxID=3988 RepID=B9SBR1_RICCO|nr:conserved hypothetical protein [Ricinus communis]